MATSEECREWIDLDTDQLRFAESPSSRDEKPGGPDARVHDPIRLRVRGRPANHGGDDRPGRVRGSRGATIDRRSQRENPLAEGVVTVADLALGGLDLGQADGGRPG